MNILFCSVGRRCELLKDFRKTMGAEGKIVATDLSEYAPAIYFADKYYLVPRIDNPDYISTILDICREEEINAVTTCIDPEIMLLAEHREAFQKLGVEARRFPVPAGAEDHKPLHFATIPFPMNSSIVTDVSEDMPSRLTNATITLSQMIFRSPRKVMWSTYFTSISNLSCQLTVFLP